MPNTKKRFFVTIVIFLIIPICKSVGISSNFKKPEDSLCLKDDSVIESQKIFLMSHDPKFDNHEVLKNDETSRSLKSETLLEDYTLLIKVAKLNKYISFINIQLPTRLEKIASAKSISVISLPVRISMPSSIFGSFRLVSIPDVFRNRGLYSDFSVNAWEQTVFFLMILCSAIALTILEAMFRATSCEGTSLFLKVLRILARNWIVIIFGAYLDDIVLYTFLQLKGLIANSLSFVECLLTLFIGICLLILAIYLISTFRRTIKDLKKTRDTENYNKFIDRWENFQMLFWGFQERRPFAHTFYLVYVFKIVASALIYVLLYELPVVSVSLQLGLTFGILIYIGVFRPIMKRINLIQLLLMESVSLMTSFLMLVLTILTVNGSYFRASSQVILLGDLIIVGNILQNCLVFAFLAIKLVIEAKTISNEQKSNFSKVKWLQLFAVFFQQAGFGFEETYTPPFSIDASYFLKGLPPVPQIKENEEELESTEKVFIYRDDVIKEEAENEVMRDRSFSFDNISQRTEIPLWKTQSEDRWAENKRKEEEQKQEENAFKPNLFISVQKEADVPTLSYVQQKLSKEKRRVKVFNIK